MEKYQQKYEEKIKTFYKGLDEKNKRQFATLQSEILGHGGIKYTSELLGVSVKTIYRGKNEDIVTDERIRKQGAGRKKIEAKIPSIDEMFLSVLKDHTAGNPMDDKVLWTNLKQDEISLLIYKKYNVNVSRCKLQI